MLYDLRIFCIKRLSRCGVIGSSVTAPLAPSASSMAAATAAPTALAPPSPAPLSPIGIERARRIFADQHIDWRHFAHCRHQIIGEGHRQRLAALVIQELFQQRAADTLRTAANDLALDQHRIDRLADVVGDQIALDRDGAGVRSMRATATCTPYG